MWSTQKQLSSVITSVVIGKKYDLFATFQEELNKNYNFFLDVLKDPVNNPNERAKVKKSNEEPLQINYLNAQKKLQPAIIEEAIALSDLFNLSELSSVELLIEAEEQMQYFHGFNRGLTAVLLYYDTKKILMNNLKLLILARSGRSWILDEEAPSEISQFIDSYVNKLISNGLISKILNQIGQLDWTKTEENLLRLNGLGSLKHRKQVKNLFEEIKILLGECVYSCACQAPLNHENTIAVIKFLKTNSQMVQNQQLNSKLNLETSHYYLVMALLYCFDTTYLDNKEQAEFDKKLISYIENDYIRKVYNELNQSDNSEWLTLGIKSLLQFSFQIYLSNLNYFMLENESQTCTQTIASSMNGLEDDETLIDKSIEQHVFNFVKNTIIQHDKFNTEKYFVERIHTLLSDFIYRMPEKIKDMRNRNEDLQRLVEDSYSNQNQNLSSFYYSSYGNQSYRQQQQNQQPVINENHDFEDFLNMIGDLYSEDPLKLELCLNYWIADSEMNPNMPANYQKPTQKQISLYKFVRYFLSGDTLIGGLYIAYVNMLKGLCTGEESAQHCFFLLQNNSHFYDSHGPKISWNHIMTAFDKYYESFRTDQTNMMINLAHQQRAVSNKGITQQELQGLISVTRLVRQIALYNEKARLALCEYQRNSDTFNTTVGLSCLNENNLPTCMFGLLTCPIPNSLKGEILNLLSTFSLSPQIAINMWQLLENSQLIQTISQQPAQNQQYFYKNDLKTELEEVEAREETYPLLNGFLSLIKNLCTVTTVPDNLGLGLRPKNALLGFQPYLHFLVNHVYLKVLYRSYKNLQEKWQLTNDVLEIFYQIISKYQCQLEDFQSSQIQSDPFQINAFKSPISNSPGYRLVYDFIHDGPIVRMLFVILNETLNHLLEFNLKNEPQIEATSLNCLKMIQLIIEKQKNFIEKMKSSNLNIESTGIEKLIISINLSSNRAEYFMSIFRFIQFNSSLINHSYYALSIIYSLSNYSVINQQILNLFLKSCLSLNEQFELMHSFVEFLEFDEPTQEECVQNVLRQSLESIDTDSDSSELSEPEVNVQSQTRSQSRLKALKLLIFYLRLPAPNISHLLLGFDIQKPLNNQQFYNPGTKINYRGDSNILSIVPRNCLHSIIRILNRFLRDQSLLNKTPQTIDLCYEILFMLCSQTQFKSQLLNYLRNEFDFVNMNLKKIPFRLNECDLERTKRPLRESNFLSDSSMSFKKFRTEETLSDEALMSLLSVYSWIVQLTCLEIQDLISARMKQHLKKLVQILTDNSSNIKKEFDNTRIFSNNNFDSLLFMNQSQAKFKSGILEQSLNETNQGQIMLGSEEADETSKFFYFLNLLNFCQNIPFTMQLNFFDLNLIENVIESCKTSQIDDFTFNIQLYDLKKLKQILFNEIKDAPPSISVTRPQLVNELKYILQNVYERNNFQLSFYFKKKYFESFKLLTEVFVQLMPCDVFSLQKRYSFVYLMSKSLLNKLLSRDNVLAELTFQCSSVLFTLVVNLRKCISQLRKLKFLSDTNMSVIGQHASGAQSNSISVINLPNLVDLFKKIIEYLLDTTLTNYKVRTHLYATILNYLMIFDPSDHPTEDGSIQKKEIEYYENIRVLLNNMNNLLKIICTDSCEGLNITTMMGLSLLNKIIDLDLTNPKWLKYLSDNGYISCMINTISNTDNQLIEECFQSQIKNDKVLFIFETKMALFSTIAKTSFGAELLIKNGLVSCLSQCSVFNLRIKFDRNVYSNRNYGYLIPLLHQFYQVFFPILNLCILIINTMGPSNIEVKSQISKFVLSHNETFLHILTSKIGDVKMLEELKLVTNLLSKLAPFDSLKYEMLGSTTGGEHNSIFSRIHKELLNLICIYYVPDQLKQLRKEIEHHSTQKENITKISNSFFAEIASNISSYSTSIMKVSQQKIPFLIFSPKIESHQLHPYSPTMMRLNSKHLQLGLLIDFLKYTIDNLDRTIEIEHELNHKNEHVNDLIEIEKKQLVGEYKMYERLSESEKQLYLKQQLRSHIKWAKHEISNYLLIIEKGLLILWRHIEFYLSNKDLNIPSYQLFRNDFYSTDLQAEIENLSKRSTTTSGYKQETREDFMKFKQDLLSSLGANFFKKCSDLEQKIDSNKRDNFINIVSKRIQRLMHLQSTTVN